MTRREIREEIFRLLFEYELIDNDIEKRINETIAEENLKRDEEIDFLRSYITEIIENKDILTDRIRQVLDGWTYERLGTIEKVLLKISFYEITIKDIGYEIAINEVLEIAKKYSYNDTKDFLNGILAKLVQNIKDEKQKYRKNISSKTNNRQKDFCICIYGSFFIYSNSSLKLE